MKKTPQKYKPKNYYISFNMKEKTSPVKIHKNPSSNQLIISEINYDYQNHSKILTKNELFPECISFRDQNIINMEEKLKNFNQNILNQKSQKKDKNNNNINAKKNLSASKNYSFRSKGNKIISFELLECKDVSKFLVFLLIFLKILLFLFFVELIFSLYNSIKLYCCLLDSFSTELIFFLLCLIYSCSNSSFSFCS